MIIPSLHRQPVPVNANEHRALRLKLPQSDFTFAATSNAIFIAGAEVGHSARDFPIVFVEAGKDAQGRPEIAPIIVCGMLKDQNLFVAANGSWRARYVPTLLSLYPFCIGHVEGDQYAMGLDAQCAALSTAEGEPLFDADGRAMPQLTGTFEALQQFDRESQRTRILCSQLRDMGLLQPSRFDATLEDGSKVSVDGFMTVDDKKLGDLSEADVYFLHREGSLGLIHAHFVSLGHLHKLAEWHAERLKAASASA